jgi:hypothetical protein
MIGEDEKGLKVEIKPPREIVEAFGFLKPPFRSLTFPRFARTNPEPQDGNEFEVTGYRGQVIRKSMMLTCVL